jgi:hypothetical protein
MYCEKDMQHGAVCGNSEGMVLYLYVANYLIQQEQYTLNSNPD